MSQDPRAWLRRIRLLGLAGALGGAAPALDAAPPQASCQPAAEMVQVAPGLYLRPGTHRAVFEGEQVANAGFVIGERCVAVLDSGGSLEEGQALACAIRRLTALPVCYVINTHVHPDHVLGNRAFAGAGVEFVGHAKLPRAITLQGQHYLQRAAALTGRPFGSELLVPPGRTVEEELVLDLGARQLVVTAHPSAHTDHDLTVYDRATRTLWLGDLLFVEHVPVIDASVNGWIAVLERLEQVPASRAVPGHGPVLPWPEAVRDTRRYLTVVRDETRAFIAGGGTLRAAQERVGYTEAEHWLLFDSFHQRNIATAFAELEWE